MATNPEDIPSPARRRITLRRSSYGGSGLAQGTQARGMREQHDGPEMDEVDDAIDPEQAARNLNEHVRAAAHEPVTIDADDMGGAPERVNPRARLSEVALAGSAAYAKEYRLTLLHRLLMRKVPIDQIARQLNVSISTIEKDRSELKRRLREIARELDINEIIGRNVDIYDEIRGMSLRIASAGDGQQNGQPGTPIAMKLAALRTALAATNDANRMFAAAGVFDALRFRAAETATGQTDMQRLMGGAEDLIARLLGDDEAAGMDLDDEEMPAKKRIVRKKGALKGLSYDDNDSDNAAQEFVEL